MNIFANYVSDIGIKKNVNQDAVILRINNYPYGDIALFAICDGMGGESYGELASASIIESLNEWFEQENHEGTIEYISKNLYSLLQLENQKLYNYYLQSDKKIGSTVSLLYIKNDDYLAINVGDSRIYRIAESIEQISDDDSLVNQLFKTGEIEASEVENHPRANVLTQCIGITEEFNPHFYCDKIKDDDIFLLCSDGFRHKLSADKFKFYFDGSKLNDMAQIKERAEMAVEYNKAMGEIDNISVIVCKCLLDETQTISNAIEKLNLIQRADATLLL